MSGDVNCCPDSLTTGICDCDELVPPTGLSARDQQRLRFVKHLISVGRLTDWPDGARPLPVAPEPVATPAAVVPRHQRSVFGVGFWA